PGIQPIDKDKAYEMLAKLREGLSDVVWSRRGTASAVFQRAPALRGRVYGKTGTALVSGNPDISTIWFVGWIDGLRGHPRYHNRRVVFSCFVTHSTSTTGGSGCGPIIKTVLEELDREGTMTGPLSE